MAGRGRPGPECGIARLLHTLPTEDSAALAAALDYPSLTSVTIARGLRRAGTPVSPWTVGAHRRGDCRCGTDQA